MEERGGGRDRAAGAREAGLAGGLAGWLAAWLAGWLAGWLVAA